MYECSFSTSSHLLPIRLSFTGDFRFQPLSDFLSHLHNHSVQLELNSGNNVLYWRTTTYTVQGSVVKPVMLRNIAISGRFSPLVCSSLFLPQLLFPVNDYKLIGGFLSGVAYTSECFQCKPGTYSAKPGSARCTPCPAKTYSNKGATVCLQCDQDKYSGMLICISNALPTKTNHIIDSLT